ncbi:6-carboxytetrahydropterin synthase [Calothrix sp. PCC 6303]|uniref:6-carboxytetrahydropterin synthase n=1 Tax=Calothrix sp. PCC 6303 TaxID=1170562 RepID=UPI0002A04B4C|nr:6-carboxytetrahydropterin synthase [Calothrix sp. PCC 6303]AFZ04376.1 6-pyruvoyl tetrahydropterin synthase and hypothetical protein [Calothrix sp. PCC 6303]
MQCIVNRRAQFSASHYYYLPELSEAENLQKFGACSKFPGHGHNYVLFISLLGEVDEYGMVLNLSDVKHVIKKEVTSQLDYSFLNNTWSEFKETLPTTENIARVIWQKLSPHLPVVRVQLFEHPELWADYMGNGMESYLTVSTHFSAAHRLAHPRLSDEENANIYGKCARPHGHGHNYHLEVTVKGQIDQRTGMLVDLGALNEAIEEFVIKPFDHSFLNKDIAFFAEVVPTAENIALYISNVMRSPVQNIGATLYKIKLIESPNNSCEIYCTDSEVNNVGNTANQPILATV